MARQAFIYGAIILFAANLLNRILAFVYQYLIMSLVGAESYGLYQMVFPAYMMALVLTTAGLPLAVSKLVSEQGALGNRAAAQKIFRIALILLVLSGATVSSLLFVLVSRFTLPVLPDSRVVPIFLICTPAIFVVTVSSAFRGYFQGLLQMAPTALAQVVEQVIRVSVGLYLSLRFLPLGSQYGAAGLASGMVAGEMAGLLSILWIYFRQKKQPAREARASVPGALTIVKDLFRLGLPVAGGRLVASAASAADSMLIPLRLQAAGYSLREATTLYGQLGGAAFTLLTFPTVFTFSLATSLVPAISEAAAKKHLLTVQHRTAEAIRITVILGSPFLVFIYFFSSELSGIFKSPNAGGVLSTLALAGIFLYLQSTTAGILQGLGHPQLPVWHAVAASAVKLIFIFHLTAIPTLGLKGAAWAYNIAFVLTSGLNLAAIARKAGLSLDLERLILQPLTASLLMAGAILLTKGRFGSAPLYLELLWEFSLGTVVYLAVLVLNKGLTREDLKRIPLVGRLV